MKLQLIEISVWLQMPERARKNKHTPHAHARNIVMMVAAHQLHTHMYVIYRPFAAGRENNGEIMYLWLLKTIVNIIFHALVNGDNNCVTKLHFLRFRFVNLLFLLAYFFVHSSQNQIKQNNSAKPKHRAVSLCALHEWNGIQLWIKLSSPLLIIFECFMQISPISPTSAGKRWYRYNHNV